MGDTNSETNIMSPIKEEFMKLAIKEAKKSRPEDDRIHPKVGVVVVKDGKVISQGHRGELCAGEHAEYTVFERKLRDKNLSNAILYTTLEPCIERSHKKLPCAKWVVKRRIKQVVIGIIDPDPRITGKGILYLREHNVLVDYFPSELQLEIEELNKDFIQKFKKEQSSKVIKEKANLKEKILLTDSKSTPLSSQTGFRVPQIAQVNFDPIQEAYHLISYIETILDERVPTLREGGLTINKISLPDGGWKYRFTCNQRLKFFLKVSIGSFMAEHIISFLHGWNEAVPENGVTAYGEVYKSINQEQPSVRITNLSLLNNVTAGITEDMTYAQLSEKIWEKICDTIESMRM